MNGQGRLFAWLRASLPAHANAHFRMLLLAGVGLTAGFGLYDLARGAWEKGAGEAALALLYGGLWLAMRGRRVNRAIVYPCLIAGTGFMLYELRQDPFVALWLPVAVMSAFGFLGKREGAIWAGLVLAASGAHLLADAMADAPVYSPAMALNIWLACVLVAFMSLVAHGWIEQGQTALMEEIGRRRRREDARRMAGGIPHLINNEMQAVIGHAELARLDAAADDPRTHDLDMVIRMARQASGHANQLVAYAREGECGGDVFAVRDMVRQAFRRWRDDLPGGVEASLSAGGAACCKGDAALLGEALEGMLANAGEAVERRHGETGGCVRIGVHERRLARDCDRRRLAAGDYVCIEIEDNGDGVPAAMRDRVFEPFVTTGFFGRGLGLASAQGIVRSHGGAIEVEDAAGGGALFRIWLPVCLPAAA